MTATLHALLPPPLAKPVGAVSAALRAASVTPSSFNLFSRARLFCSRLK